MLPGARGDAGRLVGISAAAPSFPSWKGIVVVLTLTFAVYAPTLRYSFVGDDRGLILDNPTVHSWHFLPTYFTSHLWAGILPEGAANYYRPFFLLWLRINYALFGNHACGWHSTTILVHVVATLLVCLFACQLGVSRNAALVAALIFGLHPAHIEGVAWISGVTEPLLAFLLLASFLAYVRWRREGGRKWKVISLVLFALALGEKETAVILPGLLLVYDWIFGREWGRALELRRTLEWWGEALRRTWLYFVFLALYVPLRIYALKGFSHGGKLLSNKQLVFTWPSLIWFWIRHLIWPFGLSPFNDFLMVIHPTLKNFFLPGILDVCVAVALFAAVRRSRRATFCAVWPILPLIPPSVFCVFFAVDSAHDRYLYLPSVGFAILMAFVLEKVCKGAPHWQGIPLSLSAAALCLAAVLGFGTITQSSCFRDNLTFYAFNLSLDPHNPTAESNYAAILAERGLYGPALEKFDDVVKHDPNNWAATYNLALTYYKMGNLPEAEKHFLEAIRVNPNKPDEYLYLGMTRYKSGRTVEAIASVQRAIAINPSGAGYHFALGIMLRTNGNLGGALQQFKEELAIHPEQQAAVAQIKELENRLRETQP